MINLFTSESVSEGHPDKIADQISDAILDEVLAEDPDARVACETLIKTGIVMVAGEVTTTSWVDIEQLVRRVISDIGYTHSDMGFDANSCAILNGLGKQSPDIAMGVDETEGRPQGAGDQGLMFGYACDETTALMPATILYAHRLMQKQAELRKKGALKWLRPDAKAQITLSYNGNSPIAVDTVVLSTQHDRDICQKNLREAVIEEIVKPVLPKEWLTPNSKFFINPTGQFLVGGPMGDCGLTGRKIIVDTYGGKARHGGGCFSGKDPSKVDRSAAYMARYLAKNIVASGVAKVCEIQISYAIGVAEPVSVYIDTFGTGKVSDSELGATILRNIDLTPKGIINKLGLKKAIFLPTAAYGHFGRDQFSWETIDPGFLNKIL